MLDRSRKKGRLRRSTSSWKQMIHSPWRGLEHVRAKPERPGGQRECTFVKLWPRNDVHVIPRSVCSPQVRWRNPLNGTVPRSKMLHQTSITHTHDLWWWEAAISTSGLCELQVVRSVAPLWLVLLQETGRLMNDSKLSVQAKMIQFPLSGGLLLQRGKRKEISDMKDLHLLGTERTSMWRR